jgi:hypothetical protein
MHSYRIYSLEKDGAELFVDDSPSNKRDAIAKARARLREGELIASGMDKVEVRDENNVVVWDGMVAAKGA